ncbi:hypothetical protein PG985_011501 [Apiospora marii]|uniref:Nephrocystin 3-like N-terminal domain-containing protein n=1 Tax=Apiospora marii TaxID=335849 RepID=A0ABR1R131_9PEZI
MSHQALTRVPTSSFSAAPRRNDGAVSLWGHPELQGSPIAQGNNPFDDYDSSSNNYTLGAPSSAGGTTAAIPASVIARWRNETESLSVEQRQRFLRELPETGFQSYVDTVGGFISDKLEDSHTLKVGQWIAPLVQLVDMIRPFADVLNSIYPPAGMILGGVTYVLSMSKRYVDYQEAVLAFLVRVCKHLSILDQFKKKFPETEEMQLALADVYGVILQFCVRASKPFVDSKGKPRMTGVSFFKSQFKSFEVEFGDLEKSLATHLKVFDRTAVLVLGEMSTHLQEMVLLDFKMQARLHEDARHHRTEEEERRNRALVKEQEESRRHILSWLSPTDFQKVQDEKLENTLAGTAQWLLEHESFRGWKFRSRPNLLYLHGKAGSGKSHLAATLIRDIGLWCREQNTNLAKMEGQWGREQNANPANPENQRKYAVAYVYCGANMSEASGRKDLDTTPEARSGAAAILSSMLKQLYSFLPMDQDVTLLRNLYRDNQSSNPPIDDVREGIRLVVAKLARAFIVVDGLDECNGFEESEFKNLCAFISSLASTDRSNNPASVVIFSRPGYSVIEDVLEGAASIEVDDGANQDDIELFIAEHTKKITSNAINLEDIQSTLSGKAGGMFLWVKLAINSIKSQRTDNKRKQAAKDMPKGLDGPYRAALHRVMAQEESVKSLALRTLLWIANSERPLTKLELLEALSIEEEMPDIGPDDRIDDQSLVQDCADLVLFRNGRYSLLHVSLKEYLTLPPPTLSGPFAEYWELQLKSHAMLAESCLTYLMFSTFKQQSIQEKEDILDLLNDYPLLAYSVESWGRHVAKVTGDEKDKIMALAKGFLNENHLTRLWGRVMSAQGYSAVPTDIQPLHLISFFGLTALIPYYDPAELQLDLKPQNGKTPIDMAFEQRHKGMADWLLSRCDLASTAPGADSILPSRVPLVWLAARNDWADIISGLVKKGLDGDRFGWMPRQGWLTPLQEAIQCGSDNAVQSLIDVGADLDARNSRGETALMMAIDMKRLDIVHQLLNLGADVTIHSSNGNTALTYAIRHSLLGPVTRILERDQDVRGTFAMRASLQVAALSGAHDMIEILLKNGADLEYPDANGLTPLLVAASNGHLDVVKSLLSSGAQLTAQSANNETIFHHILGSPLPKRVDVLQWVLEHGDEYAKTDQRTPVYSDDVEDEEGSPGPSMTTTMQLLDSPNQRGGIPAHLAASLGDMQSTRLLLETPMRVHMINHYGSSLLGTALAAGDFDCSEYLFAACRDTLPEFPLPDETLMIYAARSGNADLIPLVLSNGGMPLAKDQYGRTPLHMAAYWGHVEFIRSLADQVPGIDYYEKDEDGQTPLHRAVSGGELEATEFLLSHCSVDAELGDADGNWPLHLAAEENEVECVKALLEFDPEGVNRPNHKGETALHRAADRDHDSVVTCLMRADGVDVNAISEEGRSILHRAIMDHKTNTALLIIREGGALATAGLDKDGWTALHHAAVYGNEAVVRELLDCGCDPHPEAQGGKTPFWLALNYQQVEVVDLYVGRGLGHVAGRRGREYNCAVAAARCGNLDFWRRFVGSDKELAAGLDYDGQNALCGAAWFGHGHMLEHMLALDLDVNSKSELGDTALILAASRGRIEVVRYLCRKGADLNCQDSYGRTALHWAVIGGFDECQSILVEAGADQEVRDQLGVLARDYNPNLHLLSSIASPELSRYDPRSIHWPTTRNFVLQSVDRLRQTNLRPSNKGLEEYAWETKRNDYLIGLSEALYLLKDLSAAAIVNTGVALLADWRRCALCRYILKGDYPWYRCTVCWNSICAGCLIHINDEAITKQLQRMERDTVPARKALRPIAHHGHRMFLEVFNAHRALWDWVGKRMEAYNAWEDSFLEKGRRFLQEEIPGWELVNTMCRLDEEFGKTSGSEDRQPSSINAAVDLDNRLRDLFRNHSPDKEACSIDCEGHRYAKIQPLSGLSDAEKAMFGPENEFTELFFQTLEDKYRHDKHPSLSDPIIDHGNDNGIVHAVSNTGKQSTPIKQHPQPALEDDEEDMHVAADRQIEFLIDPIQHDLVRQWRLIEPGKQGRSREEQELILETAWQLAQAIAYHEVRRPSLAEIDDSGPIRSYWRKGDESGDSENDSSSLSDIDSNWDSDL